MSNDRITCVCENDMEERIGMVRRQTDYDIEKARQKLLEMNMDHVLVIKDYMGVKETPRNEPKSLQQKIYKELRGQMDNSIRDFNKKQDDKLEAEIKENNGILE